MVYKKQRFFHENSNSGKIHLTIDRFVKNTLNGVSIYSFVKRSTGWFYSVAVIVNEKKYTKIYKILHYVIVLYYFEMWR